MTYSSTMRLEPEPHISEKTIGVFKRAIEQSKQKNEHVTIPMDSGDWVVTPDSDAAEEYAKYLKLHGWNDPTCFLAKI